MPRPKAIKIPHTNEGIKISIVCPKLLGNAVHLGKVKRVISPGKGKIEITMLIDGEITLEDLIKEG